MDPLWQIQRPFVLGWLEASMESSSPDAAGTNFVGFPFGLVVQLWTRRTLDEPFVAVAEVIVPAGAKRAIAGQLLVGYGMEAPVCLPAGSQNAVVHNGGGHVFSAHDLKPTLTVTPHGTWA